MERWPELRHEAWKGTLAAVHLWTQVVGKIRLRQEFMVNHWWNVTLYVTARGLSTSAMPYGDGRTFLIDFDFLEHRLRIEGCDGEYGGFPLEPMAVATFYERTMAELDRLGFHLKINTRANEVPEDVRLDRDAADRPYDRLYVERFWRALLQADRLCKAFRSEFLGKVSPVHFFWGSFDLAVTRFSGRPAPPHPGGIPNLPDWVTREAYSHEVQSVGFWPGGNGAEALFYAYAYPSPSSFSQAQVRPEAASWNEQFQEFVLPYEAVRRTNDPDESVLSFFQSTYEAAADLGSWDRAALERH